jgi:hypothetical protein
MPTYTVHFSAYFSDSTEVEADTEEEAWNIAGPVISDDWSAYSAQGGYTVPFDDIQIEEVQEDE